jgi:hypothetical protein
MQIQAKSGIGIYLSAVVWIVMVMAASTIAAADRSNAPGASSEGEGMQTNPVLLNGDWEYSTGDGDEDAETPDDARRLKWQTVKLPGQPVAGRKGTALFSQLDVQRPRGSFKAELRPGCR